MKKHNIFLSLALSLVFSINAHAALEVRGYGTFTADGVIYTEKLIYDSTLDITWLDFTRFHTVDGDFQNWYMQTNWANTLQVDFNGQTVDGWRLPQTLPVNGLAYNYDHSFDGSTDRGYNISALGSAYPGSTGSEMANLFYYTFGNDGAFDLDGNPRDIEDYGLKNTGPFENLLGYYYFSVTENTENPLLARQFDFDTGDQSNNFKTNTNCALAVRPGDVLPVPEPVSIDIIPKSCPNECPIKGGGFIKVAILGTSDFDVTDIDIASVRLEGIAPVRSSLKDKSSPVVPPPTECECTTEGRDGFIDLCLEFDKKAIISALGAVNVDQEYVLTLSGELNNGTPIEGKDCIVFVKKGKKD